MTLEEALRELQPYLIMNVRRGEAPSTFWPIRHRRFDGRTNRMVANHGVPISEGATALNNLISLLGQIQQIAIHQRNELEPQRSRGASNRGTANRGTNRTGTHPTAAPTNTTNNNATHRRFTLAGSRHLVNEIIPQVLSLTTITATIGRRQPEVGQNRLSSTINANSTSRQQMDALSHLTTRINQITETVRTFLANTEWVLPPARLETAQNAVVDRPLLASLNVQIRRIGNSLEALRSRYRNLFQIQLTTEYMAAHNNDPEAVIALPENHINTQVDNEFGVKINWNHPHLIPIKASPNSRRINSDSLDVFLAIAVTRFLKRIKQLNVVTVYTAGFQRDPLGLNDPHPAGRAMDLTGFMINVGSGESAAIVLHLRGGHPLRAVRGASSSSPDLSNYRSGPSDWFNFAPLNAQNTNIYYAPLYTTRQSPQNAAITKEGKLRSLVQEMPNFFSVIVGPGSNAEHMDHFHLESRFRLSTDLPRGTIHCPATLDNPIPYQPLPRPAQNQRSGNSPQRR